MRKYFVTKHTVLGGRSIVAVLLVQPVKVVGVKKLGNSIKIVWRMIHMRKSVKKEKELDRSYDYADAYGFSNAAANVGFVKRRARRKLRHDEKKQLLKEEVTTNEVQSN
jgi:hypothetical protein